MTSTYHENSVDHIGVVDYCLLLCTGSHNGVWTMTQKDPAWILIEILFGLMMIGVLIGLAYEFILGIR